MQTVCRDCGHRPPTAGTCPACWSARLLRHGELHDLTIAHLDCDAFYAAIEKRDRPALRDVPVIAGGRHRGDAKAIRCLPNRLQQAVAPPECRARRNSAALGRRLIVSPLASTSPKDSQRSL